MRTLGETHGGLDYSLCCDLRTDSTGGLHQVCGNFTGAHTLLREFFTGQCAAWAKKNRGTCTRSWLKTIDPEHLTGPLCDAVIGQSGSAEMLARLLGENLFPCTIGRIGLVPVS